MIALLTTILASILPMLLKALSDRIGQPTSVDDRRASRGGLRALNKAKTSVEVATVWESHDLELEQLLQEAQARGRR